MILLGMTGSIGMGKSTTAGFFAAAGVPVHDADATVHQLYRSTAVPLVEAAFPGTVHNGAVDRQALSAALKEDPNGFARLEAIVHPLVRQAEQAFIAGVRAKGGKIAVLDIPLLLETGGDKRVDAVVVVRAPAEIQRQRVLARPGMTEEKFAQILARQMPDEEKCQRAHFIIDTSRGLSAAERQVRAVLRAAAQMSGSAHDEP